MPVTPLRESDPVQVGPHRLLGRLGQGGMGTVFLGGSPDDRAVAVKVLRDGLTDPDARRRFRHELDALRRVRGPHLVEVLDADVDADLPYLVTRFVPGTRLDDLVLRSGPLGPQGLRPLARGLADALAVMHAEGVVHRDLTPGNVLVLDGQPHVIDLGLAIAAEATGLTRSGLVVGTPGYLAPEQVVGRACTKAVDVHAWGATVAFAATGRPPYGTGRPEAVLYRIVHGEPDLQDVPAELAELVTAAMRPDPALRPAADELLAELGGPSHAQTVQVRLPPGVQPDEATTLLDRATTRLAAVLGGAQPPGSSAQGTVLEPRPVDRTARATVPRHVVPYEPDPPGDDASYAAAAGGGSARPSADDERTTYTQRPAYDRPAYEERPAYDQPEYDDRTAHDDRTAYDDQAGYDDRAAYDDRAGYDATPQGDRAAPAPVPARRHPARALPVGATTAAALAVVGAATLVAPVLGAIAVLLTLAVLRALGRGSERLRDRRERRGDRRRDPVVATLGAPWHALLAVTGTLTSLPLLLLVAALPAGAVYLADPVIGGLERLELTVATATVVVLAAGLSRRAHRHSRLLLRRTMLSLTPGTASSVALLVTLVTIAVLLLATAESRAPVLWPLTGLTGAQPINNR